MPILPVMNISQKLLNRMKYRLLMLDDANRTHQLLLLAIASRRISFTCLIRVFRSAFLKASSESYGSGATSSVPSAASPGGFWAGACLGVKLIVSEESSYV